MTCEVCGGETAYDSTDARGEHVTIDVRCQCNDGHVDPPPSAAIKAIAEILGWSDEHLV